MVPRFPSPFCTKLCGYSHQKQQEQQNTWASLGHDLMKASLHCLAVCCCPCCLKQTCLPSKEDTIMQCLLHVGFSLTLGLFRKGFKTIIFQIMLKWALVHLPDYCSGVYWFCPILSFAHCFGEDASVDFSLPHLVSFCLPRSTLPSVLSHKALHDASASWALVSHDISRWLSDPGLFPGRAV